jgi:Glyoxalase-like domain
MPSRQPCLRQAVLAAWDLEEVTAELRAGLDLGEPFSDPGVGHFGLRNAVFALDGTFLEVVSPVLPDAPAAQQLARRGDTCGYMLMMQVDDLGAARERARAAGVREVFEISLDDIDEVHLHPADMRGAIVSLSRPRPSDSWRWGGPEWERRTAPLRVRGATIAVTDPGAVAARWRDVIGALPGLRFVEDAGDGGLIEIQLEGDTRRQSIDLGALRLVFDR